VCYTVWQNTLAVKKLGEKTAARLVKKTFVNVDLIASPIANHQ